MRRSRRHCLLRPEVLQVPPGEELPHFVIKGEPFSCHGVPRKHSLEGQTGNSTLPPSTVLLVFLETLAWGSRVEARNFLHTAFLMFQI